MKRLLLSAATAVAVLAGACGGADSPPEIAYGRDVCAECHMIISEARFAAAYRAADGTERKFDDIGDMVAHGTRMEELEGAAVWVHDFETEEWVDATAAFFVSSSAGIDTPMGRGVVAFSDRDRADAYAADNGGSVRSWEELVASPPPATSHTDAPVTLPH